MHSAHPILRIRLVEENQRIAPSDPGLGCLSMRQALEFGTIPMADCAAFGAAADCGLRVEFLRAVERLR